MANTFGRYKVHVLPSWLETPGLSQLEAAACGCNIVSTDRGSTVDYFGDMAFYCNPSEISSIGAAIDDCFENLKSPKEMSDFILDQYTWDQSGKQTLQAYQEVLR